MSWEIIYFDTHKGDRKFKSWYVDFNPCWSVNKEHFEIKNNRIVKIPYLHLIGSIQEELEPWAKESGIDLANLSPEDETLIVYTWADKFVLAPPLGG